MAAGAIFPRIAREIDPAVRQELSPALFTIGSAKRPLPHWRLEGALNAPKERVAISVGHRHATLVGEAMQMTEYVNSAEEINAILEAFRDDLCEDAQSMLDSEL